MLGALLVAGAVGLLAGAVIAVFYKDIINWLNKAFQKIKSALNIAVVGSQIMMQNFAEGFKEISYHFSKLPNNQWRKDTVIKQELVSEKDIPQELIEAARNMSINQTIDITANVETQILALENSN